MRARPWRPGTTRFWIILGALVLLLAAPVEGPTGAKAAPTDRPPPPGNVRPNATPASAPSIVEVGVMGAAMRRAPRLAPAITQSTVCPAGTQLQGVDVSYYQGSALGGSINWPQVAQSGLSFAYARAADGSTFMDPDFQTNYRGIKQAGMKAGAYLYFRADEDATAQANVLVTALREAGFAAGDLEPVFDVEDNANNAVSGATIAANLQTAINVVQQSLGTTSVIYTGSYFWNTDVSSTALSANPLWIASWNISCPGLPNGWSTWSIWQYDVNATVPGITVNVVDVDESNGPTLPVYNNNNGACAAGNFPASARVTGASMRVRAFLPLVPNQARC